VALGTDARELTESDEGVLHSMIDSYDRAVADQQRFIERRSDADRGSVIGRSRHRRVRVATAAETRERGPDKP
jgi:hypothetical protein